MENSKLKIRLYGAFKCSNESGRQYNIPGYKLRALIGLLATAADGTHTRAWLQELLWGRSELKNRRESLRRALSDLKKIFQEDFDIYFSISNVDICLKSELYQIIGSQADGVFLEGIVLSGQGGFTEWLTHKRDNLDSGIIDQISSPEDIVRPTLAVIPFLTHSGLSEDAHFSDLVSLEITRQLTRSRTINVISHLSSRRFSGPMLELPRVRTALKVDYLVNGTLRCDGNSFRLDVDFVNAVNGQITWSRVYNGSRLMLLDGDQTLVRTISGDIGFAILKASVELAQSHPLPKTKSHALFMTAITDIHRHQLANFSNARRNIEYLLSQHPNYSVLHAWLAKWYILSISQGWSYATVKDNELASESIKRALDLDNSCALSLIVNGMLLSNKREEFEQANKQFDKALLIDPNNALGWLMSARMYAYEGDGEEAVNCANRANDLSPLDPYKYFFDSLAGMCHVVRGDLNRGYHLISKSLSTNPNHVSTHRARVITLQLMGRDNEAKKAAKKLLRLEPGLTVSSYIQSHPAGDGAVGAEWAKALGAAGVPVN